MDEVTDKLTDDGVRLFAEAFDKLLAAVEKSSRSEITPKVNQQTYKLPGSLAPSVKANIDDWRAAEKFGVYGSTTLRSGLVTDEANWLGWLDIIEEQIAQQRETAKPSRTRSRREQFHGYSAARAWADPVCVPKCFEKTFGKISGLPAITRARFHRSGADQSVRKKNRSRRRLSSLSPANPAQRSNRTSLNNISSNA